MIEECRRVLPWFQWATSGDEAVGSGSYVFVVVGRGRRVPGLRVRHVALFRPGSWRERESVGSWRTVRDLKYALQRILTAEAAL